MDQPKALVSGHESKHHEVFAKFQCWEGIVEAGFDANFLGVLTRTSFAFIFPPNPRRNYVKARLPPVDEEYIEWIEVLEAVTSACGQFTMIELGAGWGRWLANAAAALHQCASIPYFLVGVEAEPTHFLWMESHFRDNNIDFGRCRLIRAAVAAHDGEVWFCIGDPYNWYGQGMGKEPTRTRWRIWPWPTRRLRRRAVGTDGREEVKVRAISLNTLLRAMAIVDLIDIDVQGAEVTILEPALRLVNEKVKRVHLGTHGPKIEADLREMFQGIGWQSVHGYT